MTKEVLHRMNGLWLVQTDDLFKEIMSNPGMEIMRIPLNILYSLLRRIAERATQINDRELNKLMIRLALYSISNYHDKEDYNMDKAIDYVYDKDLKKSRKEK